MPRTVYVPYAAQVPVAPVRLAGLAPACPAPAVTEHREVVTERRAVSAPPPQPLTAAPAPDTAALNLELLKALRALNDKLEQRQVAAPPPPAPACLPAPPPCDQGPRGVPLPPVSCPR